jgi:hypothetical protein
MRSIRPQIDRFHACTTDVAAFDTADAPTDPRHG